MKNNALIALEDGALFYGESVGAEGCIAGELVFHTAMTGYQEILTDPSYAGQIVLFTSPHIGVVGVNDEDGESDRIWPEGIVVRSFSKRWSNWRSRGGVQELLVAQGKVAISGVDTRALTRLLRARGSQRVCLMAGEVDAAFAVKQAQLWKRGGEIQKTTCRSSYLLYPNAESKFHVVALDFGVKSSILQQLLQAGCKVTVLPASATFEEILACKPDGVFLSNGPGDPAECESAVAVVRGLLEKRVPLFGICLGHQLLAIACGAKTEKMGAGHHGANHPIIELKSQRVYISSQNHNFVVSEESLPSGLQITHRSLFDGTIAGFCGTDLPVLAFQGHPEASPGPHDLAFMFRDFVSLMEREYAQTV